jgi:hypothetical protein
MDDKEFSWLDYLSYTLLFGDTRPSRFWLAMVNIFFAWYLYGQWDADPNFTMQLAAFQFHAHTAAFIWIALFIVHAVFLLVGLKGKYNFLTLLFEGWMGWSIWTWTAITHWMMQGFPGPTAACALMMTWIMIRYPTHWTTWGSRDA